MFTANWAWKKCSLGIKGIREVDFYRILFHHVPSFINRWAFTHQGEIQKVNPKECFVLCLLFSNYFLIWTPLIKAEGSDCPWLCNKHDAIAWCLLGHQFFQGQLSEVPWQCFFITPWNHSGSFVLIFWVKCVLEGIDLVNLGIPLGKKKEISDFYVGNTGCGFSLWSCIGHHLKVTAGIACQELSSVRASAPH